MKLTQEQQAVIVTIFQAQRQVIEAAEAVMNEALACVAARCGLDITMKYTARMENGEMFLEPLTPAE